ncbi:MAG TPA: sigma 54-interacting transcriptional regulator [Vicinamibacterales bacterium]
MSGDAPARGTGDSTPWASAGPLPERTDGNELDRLRRLEALDELLPTLAGVLDIREVFARVSEIARRVLPHDGLGIPLLSDDRRHLIPWALAGPLADGAVPRRVPIPEIFRPLLTEPWDYRIVDDFQANDAFLGTLPRESGFRSALMVPLRLQGELAGTLSFLSFTPAFYSAADVLIARRIADHVVLAISHQRLAEEAARAAEARERAARLELRVQALSSELAALAVPYRAIGESPAWQAVLRKAMQVAPTETTVLLLGESGTGKEVIARTIHRASPRRGAAFAAINCAALPDQLLESELFGYERGAFTGAMHAKPGQIELAAGGTLLLDEVGEMNAAAQAKLLRVLETREFHRLGGTRTVKADVRIIAATNRDLGAAVARGTFREDLFYRLNVFALELPPLRDRREDILLLTEAFLEDLGRSLGTPPAGISKDARDALLNHRWPGNVRELRNTIERAAILCDGGLITAAHLMLPSLDAANRSDPSAPSDRRDALPSTDLWTLEREMVKRALEKARYNKSQAARALGLTRTQLYVRLKRYGLG